jgi:hypothetical protein
VVQKKDLAEWEKQYHGRTAEEIVRRVIARFRPSEEELSRKSGNPKKRSRVMKEGGDRVDQKAGQGGGKGNDYETESDSDDTPAAQPVDPDGPGGTGEGVFLICCVILIKIPAAFTCLPEYCWQMEKNDVCKWKRMYVYVIYSPVSLAGIADDDADDTLSAPSSQQTGPAEADAGAGCARSDQAAMIDDVAGDAKAVGPLAGGEGGGVEAAESPERKRARAGSSTYSSRPLPHSCCPFLPTSLSLSLLLRPALDLSHSLPTSNLNICMFL